MAEVVLLQSGPILLNDSLGEKETTESTSVPSFLFDFAN
jgi:hypothetical protein